MISVSQGNEFALNGIEQAIRRYEMISVDANLLGVTAKPAGIHVAVPPDWMDALMEGRKGEKFIFIKLIQS